MEYQKRAGTSGIDGQLYETKLLALILFRLQHDRTVKYFNLATNINDLGDFDDICLVVKMEGHDRPFAVFVQLKHKENDKVVIKFDNKDKVKYINSFIKIMKRVAARQPWDQFFDGNLTETDCIFILYTNAKFNITNLEIKLENSYTTVLNSLLATSDTVGCRAQDSDQFVQDLADYFLRNDLVLLSEHFVEFLIDKGNDKSMHIMNDEYVQQYHVILRRKVVDVSDIRIDEHEQDLKWRTLTFQQDFFTTDDRYLLIFREQLFKELLKKQRERLFQESLTSGPLLDETISVFLSAPSPATLTPLIITHIDSNEVGRLEFLITRPSCDVELLQQINMSRNEIDEAILAAKTSVIEYLMSVELKVSITFGNVDLTIRGSENKINRRLKYLTTAIDGLCKKYEQQESYNIVKIDDRLDDGLLSHNGGLASAVGNLFTYDEKTNMLKFSNDLTSVQKIAKKIFLHLEKLIDDIFNFRFVVKTKKFPKLHCDCTDTAREFLSKLIIYEKQSNHWKVEEILKEKIHERLSADSRNLIMKSRDTGVSVFLHYHEEILKWWMSPTTGTYLNKTSNLYERAIYNMEAEPQISALQTMFYTSKAKYFGLSFTRNTMKWMELPDLPSKVFIATDTVALTTVKVIQCLRSYFLINKFAILDFEFVLNMPITDFNSLNAEIRKTDKVLIIVWDKTHNNSDLDNRLPTFALATKEKQLVIIINKEFKEIVKEHFSNTREVFFDEVESLSNIKSQKEIIKDAQIIFQNQKICLDIILDDESVSFVKGVILDKVIHNETINIGEPLSNTQYEEVKDLYIDRNVVTNTPVDDVDDYVNIKRLMSSDDNAPSDYDHCISDEFKIYVEYTNVYTKVILVKTFLDIQNDVVLLTAAPGMGKSTLLTHLSINTKEHDAKLWIVRVNFIDYSQQFQEWYNDGIVVDALESLNFLCQVIVSNNTISFDLEITNGKAHLVTCTGNELADFKLNMFLHFYNQRRLIFVFDGCDEICPDFKDKVISFLNVAKTDLRKYKMWVTSRPYSNILPDLEIVLGRRFQLKSLSFAEQETYLRRFWNKKLLFRKPSDKQIQNLLTFIKNSRASILEADNWVRTIYSVFVDTVRPLYSQSVLNADMEEILLINTILKRSREIDPSRNVQILSGNPLLLYFLADYFVNIMTTATNRSKSILEFNLHNVYEIFIENKLKTVLFEDKNKMDLSKVCTRRLLEKELHECINIHKKLAAYIFYQSLISNKLDFEEFKAMKPFNEKEFYTELDNIKTGTEKTGLISHVTADNVPVFIHGSFLEYLIAEYICDILKSNKYPAFQKTLWYYVVIAGDYTAVKDWIEKKNKTDPTFRHAFAEMEKRLPIYKTIYHLFFNRKNMSKRQYVRILASSVNDYEDGCFSDYGEVLMNYFFEVSQTVREELNVYFKNYFISKMKPYLKQHFRGPTIFKIQCKNLKFVRDFRVFQLMDENEGIFLKIKIKHKRSAPLLMLLDHQDHCDAFQTSNTEITKKNCHKLAADDIGEKDFVLIQFSGVLIPRYNSSFSSEINKFLAITSIIGNRLHYSEQHVTDFAEKMLENELPLFDVVNDFNSKGRDLSIDMMHAPGYINLTFLKYIKPYHVILRQHVFDITDIQRDEKKSVMKWRTGTFQDKFFYTNDRHIALLRNRLFQQILSLKTKNISSQRKANILRDQLIPFFLSEPSVTTLTLLLGTYIVGDEDNELKFLIERPPSDVKQLRHISIPQSTIDKAKFAVRTAVMVYLQSIQFKAPIDFGNIDLTHGYLPDTKINIGQLKNAIVKLCEESTPHKVVTIDDTLDEQLLRASGGLASCVGNILIYDEETKMLKFSNLHQFTPSQENAKSLYLQLSHEIDNLHEYRFDVKTEKLPKCHLDYTKTAREFLGRIVIFAEQSNHYDVEEVSNQADEDRRNFNDFQCIVQSDLVSLHCHSGVLKWWKTSTTGECDTKPYDLFQQAMINIKAEPIISDLHTSFYLNNLKYFGYIFNDNVTKSIEQPAIRSKLLIVTETVILTTIKVLQRLKSSRFNNEYAVLNLEHMLGKFSNIRDSSLRAELRNTTKVLIIVCTQRSDHDTLHELAQLFEHKRMVIISNDKFRATVESHCEWSDVVFNNEIESLSTVHSHKELMRDTEVIFQGQNVSLDVIMDNESVAYVKGDVLDKMINNDIIRIGKPLSNPQYNEIKDSFIEKRVGPRQRADGEYETSSEVKVIKTFYDIVNDVVLLAAPTGMGKSTLLTHLALNTKEHDGKLWIVRMNFTDHVEQFNKWQDEDTDVDALESFKFLCQVTLNYKISSFNVAFTHDKARLVRCAGDGLATFELNLFLHFYNERRVMFVFDGVGEIDPYCKDKVVNFLSVVNTRLRKNKMWVTSKSDSAILSDLQRILGEGFKIEC